MATHLGTPRFLFSSFLSSSPVAFQRAGSPYWMQAEGRVGDGPLEAGPHGGGHGQNTIVPGACWAEASGCRRDAWDSRVEVARRQVMRTVWAGLGRGREVRALTQWASHLHPALTPGAFGRRGQLLPCERLAPRPPKRPSEPSERLDTAARWASLPCPTLPAVCLRCGWGCGAGTDGPLRGTELGQWSRGPPRGKRRLHSGPAYKWDALSDGARWALAEATRRQDVT